MARSSGYLTGTGGESIARMGPDSRTKRKERRAVLANLRFRLEAREPLSPRRNAQKTSLLRDRSHLPPYVASCWRRATSTGELRPIPPEQIRPIPLHPGVRLAGVSGIPEPSVTAGRFVSTTGSVGARNSRLRKSRTGRLEGSASLAAFVSAPVTLI